MDRTVFTRLACAELTCKADFGAGVNPNKGSESGGLGILVAVLQQMHPVVGKLCNSDFYERRADYSLPISNALEQARTARSA